MYRFNAQGRIGRIDKPRMDIVSISLASDRLVEGRDGAWTKTEWINAVSFDPALNETMLDELEVGQTVAIEGRIEPRKRKVGDLKIFDYSFVIVRFERLSKPKANGKAKPAQQAEAHV